MSQKPAKPQSTSERLVRDIRRATRKHYSAEEKIRIVLDGLRGEASVAELCRRRHRRKHVLQLVQGVFGGRQTPPGRRHGACGDQRRSKGAASGSACAEGG